MVGRWGVNIFMHRNNLHSLTQPNQGGGLIQLAGGVAEPIRQVKLIVFNSFTDFNIY